MEFKNVYINDKQGFEQVGIVSFNKILKLWRVQTYFHFSKDLAGYNSQLIFPMLYHGFTCYFHVFQKLISQIAPAVI